MARTLVINGQCPAKKNSRIGIVRNGRVMNFPSKIYSEWEKSALWQLKGQPPVEEYPISMTVIFYVRDNRSRDMDNMLPSIMDCLQKAEILADDDWKHVDTITLQFGGIDKENCRTEVWLDEE